MKAHTQTLALSPEVGKTYTFRLNDTSLYSATVEKTEGCWASVKIIAPFPGRYEKHYQPGQQLDIKVAYYDIEES